MFIAFPQDEAKDGSPTGDEKTTKNNNDKNRTEVSGGDMACNQAELKARLKFNRALQMEAGGLDHSHDINRAFVFSYFELLQWLGLDIPEFELAKMSQL